MLPDAPRDVKWQPQVVPLGAWNLEGRTRPGFRARDRRDDLRNHEKTWRTGNDAGRQLEYLSKYITSLYYRLVPRVAHPCGFLQGWALGVL